MGAFVPSDVQEFLDYYPDVRDDLSRFDNLKFYSNELRCQPDRKLISEIHEECVSRSLRAHVILGGGTADSRFAVSYVGFLIDGLVNTHCSRLNTATSNGCK